MGRTVLMYCAHDRFEAATALVDIAVQASNKTNVGVGIDIDAHIHQFAQFRLGKDQNAFDQDDRRGIDTVRVARREWAAKS